jgi:lysophospholipase L1-like esterase
LIALLVLAAVAELYLRLVLGLGNPVLVTPDAACAYFFKPNQNAYRFFCHTHINAYGMRADPVPPAKDPGTLRIMFIGDSVTYGTSHIDQSKIFTEIIHRDLPSFVHRPVEVLNASASAWAIDNELSYARSRGIFYSDVVLLVLNSADLGQPRAEISDVGEDTTLHHPTTALGELWSRFLKPRVFHITPATDAGDVAPPNADATIRANLGELDDFEKLVRDQQARFAIVYIPFRGEIPEPAAESDAALRTWAAAHQVPLFDLTSAETPYTVKEITLDEDHLNVRGNQLVAKAIENLWSSTLAP